jgi:hypothetical protein
VRPSVYEWEGTAEHNESLTAQEGEHLLRGTNIFFVHGWKKTYKALVSD